MTKHICVIGSGASGLTSIKSCLEENFQVTCYEQSNFVGGLWKYRPDDVDGLASVARTTIINSSKELSAYTDFPPPKEFANYMHNTAMHAYFEMYSDHFNLRPYIKFQHKVVSCQQSDDYEETGRWKITALNLTTNEEVINIFDGVMVCTGHHIKPLIPKFKGQEKFKGKIIHSHSYKKPQPFEDENVVIVGLGNSGIDAAVELSMFANKCYLAARRGAWVIYRLETRGKPFDFYHFNKFEFDIFSILGLNLGSSIGEYLTNLRFDHENYRLKPAHRLLGQHPTVNDTLPNRILSGTVIVKNNIQEFTSDGVIFEHDDGKVTPVDSVILATGYEISFPFLDKSLIWSDEDKVELYKNVFPPKLAHPHTLAFIGLIQPLGPLVPISENQARWFTQLMAGNFKLPSNQEMLADVYQARKKHDLQFYKSQRHQIQVNFIEFMDLIAEQYGAKPDLTKIFFTDPVLWYKLYFGPYLPYRLRLQGPHPWSGAREAILTVDERVQAPFNTRKLDDLVNCNKKSFLFEISSVILIFAIFIYFIQIIFF